MCARVTISTTAVTTQEKTMTAIAVHSSDATNGALVGKVDMKLEVVSIPISDFDRGKAFYERLGWGLDADFRNGDERAIQFTPPGSECSIHFGRSGTPAAPAAGRRMYLVVSDIQAAREDLV